MTPMEISLEEIQQIVGSLTIEKIKLNSIVQKQAERIKELESRLAPPPDAAPPETPPASE